MASYNASKNGVPANLVSLPSLSSSLHSLPQATSMSNVSLHPSMYAARAAESEAKLQRALSKTAASASTSPPPATPTIAGYGIPTPAQLYDPSSPLMMCRKKR